MGKINDGVMKLNRYGKVVLNCIKWLEKQYKYVAIDNESITIPSEIKTNGLITSLSVNSLKVFIIPPQPWPSLSDP